MRIIFSIILPLLFLQPSIGQLNVFDAEKRLVEIFDTIFTMEIGPAQDSLNNILISTFEEQLVKTEAFYYPWEGLTMIGNLKSDDGKLRVITWYLPLKEGNFRYFGFLQYNRGKNKSGKEDIVVIPLTDMSDRIPNPETKKLTADSWFGVVYYRLVSFEFRRETYYVLMGYDFNDNFSQKKIIEVLTFSGEGIPVFEGQFDMEFQALKRVIFEYSDRVAMTVNYNDRLEMVIFDHLAPFEPIFSGSYRFYGPDGSYDGFSFSRSVFHLEKDVDARNQ